MVQVPRFTYVRDELGFCGRSSKTLPEFLCGERKVRGVVINRHTHADRQGIIVLVFGMKKIERMQKNQQKTNTCLNHNTKHI